jgi:hypothetical protein
MRSKSFNRIHTALLTGVATLSMFAGLGTAQAQEAADSPCIMAGRLDTAAHWAPRFDHVDLLDAGGKLIQPRVATQQSIKDVLATIKQVRIKTPALLASCNGNQALAKGDDRPALPHATALAVSAGRDLIPVEAVSFLPLAVGGEWVELRLALNTDRVTMIPSRRTLK